MVERNVHMLTRPNPSTLEPIPQETAEAYAGRLSSLVGRFLGAQEQALGVIEVRLSRV